MITEYIADMQELADFRRLLIELKAQIL